MIFLLATKHGHLFRTLSAAERTKSTPERVEFEISFDGEEEAEETQCEHNLRASMATLQSDTDSESSDSDNE
jgi:hypothetical protein